LLDNNEANAMVIGADFANEMEAMFQRDLAEAKLITKAKWNKRSTADRIKEKVARMWWEGWL
jgi:cardiolipin synthase